MLELLLVRRPFKMCRRSRLAVLVGLLVLLIPARPQEPQKAVQHTESQVTNEFKNQLKGLNIEIDDGEGEPNPQATRFGMDPREILTVPFGDRINITSPWLFHEGHDGKYASPDFDDSDWPVLDTSQPVFSSGLYNLNEVWYRTHVRIAPFSHNLALTIAEFGGSYRLSVNGEELGGYGRMSGRGDFLIARSATFPIPNTLLEQGELVIVIHAFVGTIDRVSFTLSDGISPKSAIYLGPAGILHRDERFYYATGLSESAGILTLWAVLLILAIALSFLIPRVPVYPLLTVFAGCHLVGFLLLDFADFHYLPRTHWLAWPIRLALVASELAALEFCRLIAGVRRRFWFIAFEIFYLLAASSLFFAAVDVLSYLIYSFLLRLSFSLLLAVIFSLLVLGLKRRKPDSVILVCVGAIYLFYLLIWWALQHVVFDYPFLNYVVDAFSNHLRPSPTGDLAIIIGFLALTIVRTLRIVRERASIASEIQAARTMQQLLLARTAEPTPGFAIETVYFPAGEVGGDFFLVTPNTDGSVTVILGDVSGKGLLAAMRVSMILGVLRREPSRQPAAMLAGLNGALVSQGSEDAHLGFTTAIAVRLEPSGRYTAANAGHISPYVLGRETFTPPSLPLGLAPDEAYDTVTGQLHPGERLVLLSDGVPEARTPKGELYGFDRLPTLTLEPASFIASTARAFGQEDDITVVTIACLPSTQAPPPSAGVAVAPPPPPIVAR